MWLVCILSLLNSASPKDIWALRYSVKLEMGNVLSQYIVVNEEGIISFELDEEKASVVSSFNFSNTDSIISIKTINHARRMYFYHEIMYCDFQTLSNNNENTFIEKENRIIQIFSKDQSIHCTMHLSDVLPNVYPKTILNENIKFLPTRLEYSDRICQLVEIIYDTEQISRVLENVNTSGYKVLNMEGLKAQIQSLTGYSYEESLNILKQQRK